MASMNLDLSALIKGGEDEKTQKRILNCLYQLTEELRYWQNHVEMDNLTANFRQSLERMADDADRAKKTSDALLEKSKTPPAALENDHVVIGEGGISVKDDEGRVSARLTKQGAIVKTLTVGGTDITHLMRNAALEALAEKIAVSVDKPGGSGVVWLRPSGEAAPDGCVMCDVLFIPEASP